MTDVLPITFPLPSESATASYDYIEANAALGYGEYYAINQPDFKRLNHNEIASQNPAVRITTIDQDPDYVLRSDLDWDLECNRPLFLATAPLFVSTTLDMTTASNNNVYTRMDIKVYRVASGGGETELFSGTGAAITWAPNVTGSYRTLTKVDLTTTTIKIGEKLRINTRLYAYHAAGSHPVVTLWCDGTGRGSSITNQIDPDNTTADLGYKNPTNLIVNVPMKLEL